MQLDLTNALNGELARRPLQFSLLWEMVALSS